MSDAAEDTLMDVDETMAFLRISQSRLYQLRARNKIPYHRIGTKLVFFKSELIDWIKSGESANE